MSEPDCSKSTHVVKYHSIPRSIFKRIKTVGRARYITNGTLDMTSAANAMGYGDLRFCDGAFLNLLQQKAYYTAADINLATANTTSTEFVGTVPVLSNQYGTTTVGADLGSANALANMPHWCNLDGRYEVLITNMSETVCRLYIYDYCFTKSVASFLDNESVLEYPTFYNLWRAGFARRAWMQANTDSTSLDGELMKYGSRPGLSMDLGGYIKVERVREICLHPGQAHTHHVHAAFNHFNGTKFHAVMNATSANTVHRNQTRGCFFIFHGMPIRGVISAVNTTVLSPIRLGCVWRYEGSCCPVPQNISLMRTANTLGPSVTYFSNNYVDPRTGNLGNVAGTVA